MRRILPRMGLIALLALGVASCNRATNSGSASRAAIASVRVGIPPGPLSGDDNASRITPLFKAGRWMPILVTLEGKDDLENAELVVQTVDSDDVYNEISTPLGTVKFSAEVPTVSTVVYGRPGKTDSNVTVTLKSKGQVIGQPHEESLGALESNYFLYLTLGACLGGLRLPGVGNTIRNSEIAAFDRVSELPAKWYGYNTVDLAVLMTGNDEFTSGWLDDANGARREALIEWVRRGGKLVLCVGKNETLLKNREDLKEFLPVDFEGSVTPNSVKVNWSTFVNDELGDAQKKSVLTIAKLKAKTGRGVRTLVSVREGNEVRPFVVQASYGMGRITILATDPELAPFNRWKSQGAFWQRLLSEAGPIYVESKSAEAGTFGGISEGAADDDASQLQRHVLENFDGVPVISFAWVALFILVYILIVGPLDYLFLKKVVKRLELTWVTFPIVVLIVSAAAYFTAYALKGDSQKINKLDLIDYDLRTRTVQGTTWFSIFSLRVQNYTLGVEPAEGWGIAPDEVSAPLVSWMGRANNKRQSLFHRSYEYDPHGGLRRVPIQVWSTKGFQAEWYHPIDTAKPPFTVDLQSVGGEITGSITSHLPANLRDVELFYKGNVYKLETLIPGAANRKQITSLKKEMFSARFRSLLPAGPTQVVSNVPGFRSSTYSIPPAALGPIQRTVTKILFHEAIEKAAQHRTTNNALLRDFDQSWRVDADSSGEDAILVGALDTQKSTARDVIKNPATVTRLRMGSLPGDQNSAAAEVPGDMRQDTFIRVFVPVKIKK